MCLLGTLVLGYILLMVASAKFAFHNPDPGPVFYADCPPFLFASEEEALDALPGGKVLNVQARYRAWFLWLFIQMAVGIVLMNQMLLCMFTGSPKG